MGQQKIYSEHFPRTEVACKHCGKVGRYPGHLRELISKLETLRECIGNRPIHVTNAYRCPVKNAELVRTSGADPNSPHLYGQAADIWVEGLTVDQLADAAERVGFPGVLRYYTSQFVHVDVAGYRRRVID